MQDEKEQNLADARVTLLSSRRITTLVLVGSGLTAIFTVLIVWVSFLLTSADGPKAISIDFRVYWAAGKMALDGDLLGVFDTERLTAVHNVNPQYWMPWLYPPGFLFLVAPLGAVSFATGFAIFSLLTVTLMTLAVRPFAAGSWVAWLAFSIAPAYLPMLVQGQNGLIWLAGLLAAFAALRDERWILAGIFIGLLTIKPQYGLLIPVALVAAGLWRTFLSASATTLVVAAVPTIWTGLDYWGLFIQRMGEYHDTITTTLPSYALAVSPFSLFVQLGVDHGSALVAQGFVTLSLAICVFLIWRVRRVCFDTKAASLLIASFLGTPIMWYNETSFMALVGLFMIRAGLLGRSSLQMLLLLLLWFGAGPQVMAAFVGLGEEHFPWAMVTTPVMVLCLSLCLSHALSVQRTNALEG